MPGLLPAALAALAALLAPPAHALVHMRPDGR